jgi:transcriptional regulator with XRE-family HTH domain
MKSSENFAVRLTPFCCAQGIPWGVNYIRAWRKHRGLTGEELGAALDPPASAGTISSYETNKRKASQFRLGQIAAALKTTPGKLLDEPPPLPGSTPVVTMPAEVIDIWDHIPDDRRSQAIALLRVLAERDEDDKAQR